MALNEPEKIIVAFLTLTLSIVFASTDHYHNVRPTSRLHSQRHQSHIEEESYTRYATLNESSRNQNHARTSAEDTFVYPDKLKKPSCFHGLCVNVTNYPKDQIERILGRSHFMNGYFEASEEYVSIDNRFNTDEMALCETKVHTIYPEKANNTMKVEKVIVNVEGHKQGIVFETCINNGKCKFSSNFPTGYTSYCKQKYIHKRLMVLGDNDKFVFDSFEVPSCCVCTVTRTN